MEQNDHIDPADPRIVAFYDAARNYCGLIDELRRGSSDPQYLKIMRVLSVLNEAAISLPFDMPDEEMDYQRRSDIAYESLESEISASVTPDCNAVLQAHRHLDEWEVGRIRLLPDDLADIYLDLDDGIQVFRSTVKERVAEAIWIWRFNFEVHWGRHLYRAMHTVHEIRCLNHLDES